MAPVWLTMTKRSVELGTVVCLLLLGGVALFDALRLGPGWGETGPQPGFFPFVLTIMLLIGVLGVLYADVYRQPDRRPFFEVSQEVTDLLKVGVPIAVVGILIRWLGLYLTAALYLAFFMGWYGRYRWYTSVAGGVLLSVALWLLLREGFNIAMPMSVFYRKGILPV